MSWKFWMWAHTALFYVLQNNYFGWHGKPQSDTELIVDGITMLMACLSCAAMSLSEKSK